MIALPAGIGLAKPSGSIWTPADLAVPAKVWLDGDIGVTDVSGNASAWADQTANGFNYTQATSGVRPLIVPAAINGRTAIRFNGSSQFMTCAVSGSRTAIQNVGAAWTFAVYKKINNDTSGSLYRTIGMWPVGGRTRDQRYGVLAGSGAAARNLPGLGVRRIDGTAYAELSGPSALSGSYHMVLWTMDYTSGGGQVWVDGVVVATNTSLTTSGNTSNTSSSDDPVIGCAYASTEPGYFGDVELASYIVGSGSVLLTPTEIPKMFAWAAARFGL